MCLELFCSVSVLRPFYTQIEDDRRVVHEIFVGRLYAHGINEFSVFSDIQLLKLYLLLNNF